MAAGWRIAGFAVLLMALAFLPAMSARGEPEGLLSITFDDSSKDQLKFGLSIAQAHDIRGTLYVPTLLTMLSSTKTDYEWLMTWDEIAKFRDAGWEIGSHSRTHSALTRIPDSYLDWEMSGSRNDIEVHLDVSPTTFSAPFGEYDEAVVGAARKVYDGFAIADGGRNLHDEMDRWHIKRFEVSADMTASEVCTEVEAAALAGDWLVLLFHGIVDGNAGAYEVSASVFRDVLACAAELRDARAIDILPVDQALARFDLPG